MLVSSNNHSRSVAEGKTSLQKKFVFYKEHRSNGILHETELIWIRLTNNNNIIYNKKNALPHVLDSPLNKGIFNNLVLLKNYLLTCQLALLLNFIGNACPFIAKQMFSFSENQMILWLVLQIFYTVFAEYKTSSWIHAYLQKALEDRAIQRAHLRTYIHPD